MVSGNPEGKNNLLFPLQSQLAVQVCFQITSSHKLLLFCYFSSSFCLGLGEIVSVICVIVPLKCN